MKFSIPSRLGVGFLVAIASVVVGLLLRAEYLRELLPSPFGRHLVLDAEWYDQAAKMILSGKSIAPGEVLFRPPLYPYVLAAIYKFFGPGLLAPRLLQTLLGLATAFLVARVARLVYGEKAAQLSLVFAATYGMFIYYEAEILTASLGVFLVAAATVFYLEGLAAVSMTRLAFSGLCIGLAAISHGTLLVIAPVALGALFLRSGRKIRLAFALCCGLLIPLGGVTARNFISSREFVILGSQGGVNFYIGNNAASDGKSALAPGFAEASQTLINDGMYHDTMEVAARTLAERDLGRKLTSAEINDYWFRKGLRWVREHPLDAAAHAIRKVFYFWNGHEISNNRDLHDQARRQTPIMRFFLVQSTFLIPLALYGMVRGRKSVEGEKFLILMSVAFSLATAVFFVCARFRLPAFVWLIPLASAGSFALLEDLKHARRERRRFFAALALLLVLVLVTNPRLATASGLAPVTIEKDAPFHRFNLAVLLEQEGNDEAAIAEYRAAAESGIPDPRIHLNLGNALTRTGRFEEARAEYREVLRMAPDYAGAVHNNFGILAAHEGDWDLAISEFEASLEADASNANVLSNLASAYLTSGRFDQAIVAFRRALLRPEANEAILRRSLGMAYYESGLLEEAEDELVSALRSNPQDLLALLTMAKVCMETGRESEAQTWWETARQFAPNSPAVEEAIRNYQAGNSRPEESP